MTNTERNLLQNRLGQVEADNCRLMVENAALLVEAGKLRDEVNRLRPVVEALREGLTAAHEMIGRLRVERAEMAVAIERFRAEQARRPVPCKRE